MPCGICGFVAHGAPPPERPQLQRMTDALAHRGPDADGLYLEGPAGLGSRRLSIIDVEGGRQPISNEDGSIWIVYNGEVFNYRELREGLIARGHRFATATDTEVVVHLYEDLGAECVKHLRGMFAFALWDASRETLFLARDRLGIKPLYYAERGGVLAFASELKGLLQGVPGPREIDPYALEDYITLGYIPSPRTICAGIHKLPPAHFLEWSRGQGIIRRYWSVQYSSSAPYASSNEASDRLRALLEEAVRAWMISDVPVGAFLSGGIDSSAVTALMCRSAGGRVRTYSIGFDDPAYDELRFARQVAQRYGTDHHEVVLDASELTHLPRLVWSLDEPLADDSAVPTFVVSRLAHADVKVVLSGDGGDELFGGYAWTYRDQWRRWVGQLPTPLRWTLGRLGGNGGASPYISSWPARLQRSLRDAAGTMEDGYVRRTTVAPSFKHSLYHPALRAQLNGYDGTSLVRSLLAFDGVKDARESMLRADQSLYLPDDILFKVDRMSMAHSLEVRTPLLDHHLVEFAASLSYDFKVRRLTSKYLLKRAVRDLLPAPLLGQRKHGFSMPIGRWLRNGAGATVRAILLGGEAQKREFWSRDFVRWMLEEHQSGRHDFGRRLWSLLVLEVWARLYLDAGCAQTAPAALSDLT